MLSTPPRPTNGGNEKATRFMQWVWDCLVREMRIVRGPGTLTQQTTGGVVHKPIIPASSGRQYILPIREITVCERQDDGSLKERYMKVHASPLYDKDENGDPVYDEVE